MIVRDDKSITKSYKIFQDDLKIQASAEKFSKKMLICIHNDIQMIDEKLDVIDCFLGVLI